MTQPPSTPSSPPAPVTPRATRAPAATAPPRSEDLVPGDFPVLDWSPGQARASLDALAAHAKQEARTAIHWYYGNRRKKRIGGRWLRGLGIVLGVFAGVIPVLAKIEALQHPDGTPYIDPVWATVLAAFTGLFILFDRFWGLSSAWVRYILTGQQLSRALKRFRVEWERERVTHREGDLPDEVVQARIDRIRDFLVEIESIVHQETQSWAEEFQVVLRQLERNRAPEA